MPTFFYLTSVLREQGTFAAKSTQKLCANITYSCDARNFSAAHELASLKHPSPLSENFCASQRDVMRDKDEICSSIMTAYDHHPWRSKRI